MSRWNSIGPSVVKQGQGGTKPDVSGRTTGIAVARGGNLIYVATANGGVWRSNDAGNSWHSLMEAFDLDPRHPSSDSLACGAIAIDLDNTDRIYVGTGDGPGAAYFGVGPIVSIDGGVSWNTEPVSPGSPQLAGSAFYALAIDPMDPQRVVAGTRKGVYRREPDGSGGYHWASKNLAVGRASTSVVVANKNNITTFFAAHLGANIYSSTDGHTWNPLGTGFPSANAGQVRLAVQPDNPDMVYALAARPGGSFLGVFRWDRSDGVWKQINNGPSDLFGSSGHYQGWYDIAIAVDPNDDRTIYLGGSTKLSNNEWSGSVYRSTVSGTGQFYSMNNTYIGNSVHADIHNLVFAPGDSDKLWLGCDGGVFYSSNPKSPSTSDIFVPRNSGLTTLMMEHMDQHPTDSNLLFCGTQDNGGLKFSTNHEWLFSSSGDSGFQIINWHDSSKILSSYVYETIRISTNGGSRNSYSNVDIPIVSGDNPLWYAPFAGTPYNPNNPTEADIVAFGSVRPWISNDFGRTWRSIPDNSLSNDRLYGQIRSLVFTSATKLYAGTMGGGVYRLENNGGTWSRTRLDTMGGSNTLPLSGIVTDIAADPTDPSGNSIYIAIGGHGDYRHVWHFDGTQWQQRSGPSSNPVQRLLDVHANAIIVDPNNPSTVYVGMDIGCWRSTDGGNTWSVFSEGLPDSAVMDLKIHPSGIIRVSTHGRGVFERQLISTGNPPDAISDLSATAVSSNEIELNWTAPNDNGSPIVGYQIERESPIGGGFSIVVANTGGASTTFSDTGLISATQYNYRISAINGNGVAPSSNEVSATTLSLGGVSNPPRNFTARATNTSQINLSWDQPTNTGAGPVMHYEIKRKEAGSNTWITLQAVPGATTSITDNGLRKCTTYNYEIMAINSIGNSAPVDTSAKTKCCFILTAAYGSELETKAYHANRFINEILLKSRFEKPTNTFLKFYFRFSPSVANLMESNKSFKYVVKYSIAIPFLGIVRFIDAIVRPFIKQNS